jgi:putative ABC transport system permease protein
VPFVYGSTILSEGGATHNVNTFGAPEGGPGIPKMSTGRGPSGPGEIAVSDTMGRKVGEDLEIGSRRLHIVGIVHDSTGLAGQPNAFLTVTGAQQLMFSGQPLVSSIGILGKPSQAPEGFRLVDRDGGVQDMVRALQSAKDAIRMMAWFLWVVAALIVGAVIYLSAFERTRDFAVFKAVGVANRSIMSGLALQAVLVALVAAAIGCVLALAMGPLFPIKVVVPMSAFLLLPVVAVVIGLLASLAGLHRAATVDPARAFGGP